MPYGSYAAQPSIYNLKEGAKAQVLQGVIDGEKAEMLKTRMEELGEDIDDVQDQISKVEKNGGLTPEGNALLNFSKNIFGLPSDAVQPYEMGMNATHGFGFDNPLAGRYY